MVKPQIVQYVKSYQAQGYNTLQIRAVLRQGGLSEQDIDDAFAALSPTHRIPTAVIVIAVLGLLIIISATLYQMMAPAPVSASMTLKLSPVSKTVDSGGKLTFIRDITRSGGSASETVSVNYRVTSSANKVIAQSKETVVTKKSETGMVTLPIPPQTPAGQYTLYGEATGKTLTSKGTFVFEIKSSTTTVQPGQKSCLGGCDDLNPCSLDVCDNGVCKHEKLTPCCGNGVCEEGEVGESCEQDCGQVRLGQDEAPAMIKTQAIQLAKRSSSDASALCRSLPRELDQDECFSGVASSSQQSGICAQINNGKDKDSCFMDFVINRNEFALCEQIEDVWLKNSCYSYRNMKGSQ